MTYQDAAIDYVFRQYEDGRVNRDHALAMLARMYVDRFTAYQRGDPGHGAFETRDAMLDMATLPSVAQ